MVRRGKDYTLIVRLKGPATQGGRVGLSDLVELGKHVQAAVERVARILRGQVVSQRPGPKPKKIKAECSLEVVAMNDGSFELVLDVPRRGHLPGMSLGEQAAEALVDGFAALSGRGTALPLGYDGGVLHSVRDIGHILKDGINSIQFETKKRRGDRTLDYDRAFKEKVVRRIREPITNKRSVEGRLLMADFKHLGKRCRVHPPSGPPVLCTFGEDMLDAVYEFLRRNVRVTGEATVEPENNRIRSTAIADIEPVAEGEDAFEGITAEEFWEEKDLDQLAEEQDVHPVGRLEDVLGRGASLWDDDDSFDEFLRGIYHRRRDRKSS